MAVCMVVSDAASSVPTDLPIAMGYRGRGCYIREAVSVGDGCIFCL